MYRYSTTGTVLDLASTATVYSSYLSAAPAARMPRAAVAADGCTAVLYLEVGDRVVVVVDMRSGQRCILRCGTATQAASTSTSLAKINCSFLLYRAPR